MTALHGRSGRLTHRSTAIWSSRWLQAEAGSRLILRLPWNSTQRQARPWPVQALAAFTRPLRHREIAFLCGPRVDSPSVVSRRAALRQALVGEAQDQPLDVVANNPDAECDWNCQDTQE